VRLTVEVVAPAGSKPLILPRSIDEASAVGTIAYEATEMAPGPDGQTIIRISGDAQMRPALVVPAAYGDLFDLAGQLSHRGARTVLLQLGQGAPAAGGLEPAMK
jgi:hypothetical protein